MVAIAQLKALLGIDTSEYRTGMTQADQATHSLAMKLQSTERQLQNTAQVGRGFAAVLSGNIAGGVRQVVDGLDLMAGKAAIAVAKIGAVFAAFGAGWQIGTALDKKLGLSDKLSKPMVTVDLEKGRTAESTAGREQRRKDKSLAEIEAGTEKLTDARLSKEAKLTKEYGAEVAATEKAMREARTQDEADAYARRLEIIKKFYADDIKAMKDAETIKAQEQVVGAYWKEQGRKKAALDAENKVNASFDEQRAAVNAREFTGTGRNVRIDAMAAIGGMVGGSRAGVGAADKQLQKMMEDARRQEEIVRLNQEQRDALNDLRDGMNKGAP